MYLKFYFLIRANQFHVPMDFLDTTYFVHSSKNCPELTNPITYHLSAPQRPHSSNQSYDSDLIHVISLF